MCRNTGISQDFMRSSKRYLDIPLQQQQSCGKTGAVQAKHSFQHTLMAQHMKTDNITGYKEWQENQGSLTILHICYKIST